MQNKIYAVTIIAFTIIAFIVGWAYLKNTNPNAPINAPLVEVNLNAPSTPAAVMSDAERNAVKDRYMSPTPYFFPNEYDSGLNEDPTFIPAGYRHLLSLPFHNSKDILRVYANIICPIAVHANADCIKDDVVIVKYDPASELSTKIASISPFQAANYGGVFVPLALTPNDKNIVLRAWMGSPGGGSVDLGYSEISVTPKVVAYSSTQLPHLASAVAIFYDSYGKVISLEESSQTLDWSQPGRSPNQGALVYRNLITGGAKTLANGADTTYEIRNFDENTHELGLQVIRYAFSPECPRSDKILDCADKTAANLAVRLP